MSQEISNFHNIFENLVCEGGGVKGIAFYGAITRLSELGILNNFKRFAGSSAGAVAAIVLACRFPLDLIKECLVSTKFKKFMDDDYGVINDTNRLFHKYGWHKGNYILKWFGKIMLRATGNSDLTFKQAHEKYGTELVLTGTCVNTYETIYYSRFTYPDKPIREALRISMGIPLFFKAIKENGLYYIDGGVINNFPIWIFDKYGNICTDLESDVNTKTLGLKLISNTDLKTEPAPICNLLDFSHAIIHCLRQEIERTQMKKDYWKTTISIHTGDISSTNFNLTYHQIDKLITAGYNAVLKFFEKIQNQQ